MNILHFWLDHLEVYTTFNDESLFNELEASQKAELDEYSIEKNLVPKYEYKILFRKDDYPVFAYYKWTPRNESNPVWTRDYIVCYSTAFKLMEYEEVCYFLENYSEPWKCKRFDICMDILEDTTELLTKKFKPQKTGTEFTKSGNIETRYYWELQNTKNKRQLIRVYDKISDIKNKKKIELYKDYLIHDKVTRVELEVRLDLAKNMIYKNIFNDTLLIWIFKNYLYKWSPIFEEIKTEKITLYKAPEIKFNSEDYQGVYYKTEKKGMFLWYAKTIFNLWFCPVRVLILAWFVKEKTLMSLWLEKVQDIYKKEKEVAEEHYFKRNFKEFMDELYSRGK